MIGFRIYERSERVAPEWVEKFKTIPVANVSDCMSRMTAGGASLRPMHAGGVLAGAALTVKTRPGDNLMVHKALAMAQPGDVIVVDAGGDLTNAIIGGLMAATAQRKGVAGIIIHGAIRDSGEIAESNFPVYAAGVTHRGPYKDGPGEINVTVSFGGMVIQPGDLILADEDGCLSIPKEDVEQIYEAAVAKNQAEARTMEAIVNGTLNTSWIDKTLAELNCEFVK